MERDRLKAAFAGLVSSSEPLMLYRCMWRARLVSQSADLLRVGVVPEDERLPAMDQVALRTGVPGVTVKVRAGAFLKVGWDDGNPSKPFAALWDGASATGAADARGSATTGGGQVEKIVIAGVELDLGGLDPSDFALLASAYRLVENKLMFAGFLANGIPSLLNAFTLLSAASTGPLASLQFGFNSGVQALQAFQAAAEANNDWLSETVKVK